MYKVTEEQITTIIASLCADSREFTQMFDRLNEDQREDFAMSLASTLELVFS
jgi:hypothetical protein